MSTQPRHCYNSFTSLLQQGEGKLKKSANYTPKSISNPHITSTQLLLDHSIIWFNVYKRFKLYDLIDNL